MKKKVEGERRMRRWKKRRRKKNKEDREVLLGLTVVSFILLSQTLIKSIAFPKHCYFEISFETLEIKKF